jgi:hypothetical protein
MSVARPRIYAVPLLLVSLAGCGYVGPVLPPSPMLPQAVADLSVIERGDQLVIQFSVPVRTTDNLVIREFKSIDLRVGPAPVPFDFDRWAAGAMQIPVEPPPAADPDNPLPAPITKEIPAREWIGKRIAIAVRTSTRKKDRFSAWSNRATLQVLPPLLPPAVTAESTAKGVLLSWPEEGKELEYRIYRKSVAVANPIELATVKEPKYLDTSSQYETPYEYTAVAFEGSVESLPSAPVRITTKDIFPPSVPTGVAALGGPNSIEVSWHRSPESDLKGYFVYRSVDNGPLQQVGGLVAVPSYSDHDVQHGKTYRYQISAVDQHDNQSAKSDPVEVNY